MVTIELFLPLMAMIGNRGMFYGAFYTFVLVLNQVAAYYAVDISIRYNWQQFYIIAAVGCFVLALLHWIFMHDRYFALKVPLHYIDWLSVLLLWQPLCFRPMFFVRETAGLASFKQNYQCGNCSFCEFFIACDTAVYFKRPYLSFKIFTKNNVQHGLFMLLPGHVLGTTSLQNTFAVGVLGYDQLTNAKLNLLMIPGLILAGVTAIFWFKKKSR